MNGEVSSSAHISNVEVAFRNKLALRKQKYLHRSLADPIEYMQADFCSNDYLGKAREATQLPSESKPFGRLGSTGSRLISGNTFELEEVETAISKEQGFEEGLFFSSGYMANLGLLSCVAGRGDSIILDSLAHASLIDGAQLSLARRLHFKHNDLADLEKKLQKSSGQIFVVVESVYSMDGDRAPLLEMLTLCNKYEAALIVDEAHGLGVIGQTGQGLVAQLGIQKEVFACIYTFGKAVGYHGAMVCGESWLKEYLINFCRPFIYTTAPPAETASLVSESYEAMKSAQVERELLHQNIAFFVDQSRRCTRWSFLESDTQIQAILCPGNAAVKKLEYDLRSQGFAVKAILSPTVAKGSERIRICLHSYNTTAEIASLLKTLNV